MRQLVVVQGHIALQGLLHIFTAVEPVGLQNVRNAAIEPLHHAIGSGCPGLGQPVLYAQFLAQLIELMVAAGFAFLAGKQAVCELLAFVCQQLADPDRAGPVQLLGGSSKPGRFTDVGHERVVPDSSAFVLQVTL